MTDRSVAEEIAQILGDGVLPDSRIVQRLVALVERERTLVRDITEAYIEYLENKDGATP